MTGKQLQRAAFWALLLGVVVLVVALGAMGGKPAAPTADFQLSAEQKTAALSYARAMLKGEQTAAPAAIQDICGRHAFVELFRHRRTNYIFGASHVSKKTKKCLPEAIQAAVQALEENSDYVRSWKPHLDEARLGVEVRSTELRKLAWKHYGRSGRGAADRKGWHLNGKDFELGLDGVLFIREHKGETLRHIVPAMEAIAVDHGHGDTYINLRTYAGDHLQKVGVMRYREKRDKPSDVDAYAFKTDFFLEAEPGKAESPLSAERGNLDYGRVDADDIYDTAAHLTDYLVRVMDEQGRFDYEYYPNNDRSSPDYNIVRHAGTTYSILFTYKFTGDEKYLKAGLRAKDYIISKLDERDYIEQEFHSKPGAVKVPFLEEDGTVKLLALVDANQATLGATALSLLAFAQIPPDKLSPEDAQRIKQMVNFMWFLQCESGGFYKDYQQALKGKCPDPQPLYYPGETLLALNALYQVDPKPQYLDIARRSVKFEIDRFYAGSSADHWVMQALELLQKNLPEEAEEKDWVKAGWDMGLTYIKRQNMSDRDYAKSPQRPEYEGGYYSSMGAPYNTPAGSRSEAVAGIYRLMKNVGRREDADRMGDHLLAASWFITREMYRPETIFYVANPEKALWGLRGVATDQAVRIDFNQHALVAVWGAWQVALERGGIGWPLPKGKEADELKKKAAAGELITKWGTHKPE